MMVRANNMRIQGVFAEATNRIAEGEVLQLLNVHDPDTDETRYFDVIERKTAKLFEAAAEIGGLLAEADEPQLAALREYGMQLGVAFQLIDDVLDYDGDEAEFGKHVGDDLAEGKPTLPLIVAMREGSAQQRELIRSAIEAGGLEHIDSVMMAVRNTGALDYARNKAHVAITSAKTAVSQLPANDYRESLLAIADLTVHRRN
jgi:octaprenyl-diphosphate synthase